MEIVGDDTLRSRLAAIPHREPRIVVGGNFLTPLALLAAAEAAIERWRLFILNAQHPIPARPGITYESPFLGPAIRDRGEALRYLPMRLSLVPTLLGSTLVPDIVMVQTSLPIAGRISLGTEVNILPAAIEAVRAHGGLVIAQLNPLVPYVLGDGEIEVDAVDWAIEAPAPLHSPSPREGDDPQAGAIADHVAGLVPNGSTLQLGIGAIPDRVLARLEDRRDLHIWSEMVSDGVLALERRGALDRSQPITASFLFGSPELYEWADRNPRLRLLRTETVNDPARIMRQPRMTAINAALQVDLFAQANACHVGARVISGFGGQPDFTVGALHATEGQSIIALRAWHTPTDTSSVRACLDTPVTSFQHSAVVSEHGVAHLFGASAQEQAQRIVTMVADPRARDDLDRYRRDQ